MAVPRVRTVALQRDVALCLALLGGVTQCDGRLSSRELGTVLGAPGCVDALSQKASRFRITVPCEAL